MVNGTPATTLIETDLFKNLGTEAGKKEALGSLQERAKKQQQSNEEFLKTYRQGTEQVLAGGVRDVQAGQSQLEAAIQNGKEFTSFVGQTVSFLTDTFGEIEEYLGGITAYRPEEQAFIDQANKLKERANHPILKHFINKAKLETQRIDLEKRADDLRTERILSASLDENVKQILDYYKSMKDVMYQAGINNRQSEQEIKTQRDATMEKLVLNEKQYDGWQQTKTKKKVELSELELELATLTGEARTAKDQERLRIKDEFDNAEKQEEYYFGVIKNARNDLEYQEKCLSDFRNVIRGINTAIVDMQEKIDNRTVLFTNIETVIKTGYQVRTFGKADVAMDKTMAKIIETSALHTAGILDELGSRTKAKPMSPDDFKKWTNMTNQAREKYESIMGDLKTEYATPGSPNA